MKYKQWLNIWLENYIKMTSKLKTYTIYKNIIENRLKPKFGEYELNEISPLIVQYYISELLTQGNKINNKGLSPSTINLIITIIQNSLKTAYSTGKLKEYTLNKIKRPKLKEKEITCFTLKEQKKIEQAILSSKKKKLIGIIICLYTGLRIGELLALQLDDIDFNKGIININKTCYEGKNYNEKIERILLEPKTKSSKRTIPIPKQILPLIINLKKNNKTKYLIEENNKFITIRSYQRSFSLLLKHLNIPHKGFHSLRHTFATRAIENGMDVKSLSEILGHKNSTITLNRYAHSLFDYKQEMMNKLGKLLIK